MSKKVILLGNEAIARGAYEAGVTVAVAYPGTPSTEITENIAKYVAAELEKRLSPSEIHVARVTAWESEDACATYLPA